MYNPATRLLTVLELLQAHGRLRGADLARRLEVDQRSVRRYVTMLQDLGIPLEADRGRYGGYRLRPGFKLPPLMFSNDEALAVTLGLLAVGRLGMAGAAPAVQGALAKVDRVLPDAVRAQVQALQEVLVLDLPSADQAPAGETVLTLSRAARERRRVWLRYRSGAEETERLVDPYGLVYRTRHWYAAGWCHLRSDLRVFRLDRVLEVELRDETFTPPADFDPREHLYHAFATMPARWTVEVLLETSLEEARERISPVLGVLEEADRGVTLRCRVESLPAMAHYLAGVPFPFTVVEPPELVSELHRLAARITRCADGAAAVQEGGPGA